MQVIETNVYEFNELSESAKEKARDWYRESFDYPWFDDVKQSMTAFCDEFGVRVIDWNLGDSRGYIDTDAQNSHFRGLKLSNIDRESMPTGYCADNDLFYTFFDEFKRSGDALHAFNEALNALVLFVERDIECMNEDEHINENIEANGYTFTESGVRYG